jgi:predicted nucleotidyltransferase
MMKLPAAINKLDAKTQTLVEETIQLLAKRFPELIAIILYGSVARGEERPITDPYPSDVDLLAIFDTEDPLIMPLRSEIIRTIGDTHRRHLDAPRDVNIMLATRTMDEWDSFFIEHVAHDGIILFARGPLPPGLASLETLSHP